MIMIAHHHPPIDSRSRPPAKQIQISDPGQPIVIIMVNGLAPVASRHHMIDGSSYSKGNRPRNLASADGGRILNIPVLTPFLLQDLLFYILRWQ